MTLEQSQGMFVSVLASSSSGNATYIETPKQKVLVDAGLSGKKLAELMSSINRDLNDVDALFVTHEHSDHIHGVGVLARRYHLDVYANEGTWQAMAPKIGKVALEQQHIFEMGTTMTLGDLDIESFGISHDAAEPQFYQFHHEDKAFAILTDTGYVSDRVAGTIKDADGYLMECNHDLNMLRNGLYPWSLKQRILGDRGHLSNDDGAETLMEVLGQRTKHVFLGHLSQENNFKDLAHATVTETLRNHDYGVGHDFKIIDTDPAIADPLIKI